MRFLREARAAAKIHHPNVARVSHYGEQDGECFYAMELVEGETLEARVQRDGPLPLPLALEVIQQQRADWPQRKLAAWCIVTSSHPI